MEKLTVVKISPIKKLRETGVFLLSEFADHAQNIKSFGEWFFT